VTPEETKELFGYLARIAAAMEKQNHETELHWKRAEAGKKGGLATAKKARRSHSGKFVSALSIPDREHSLLEIQPSKTEQLPSKPENSGIGLLIKVYIDAWRQRYQTKAKPDITKAIGVFRGLLKQRKPEEIAELLQVFCQMEDKWFGTKGHDIVTFGANIGKIALAHDKGHERPNGEKSWMEIVEERGYDKKRV